MTQIAPSTWSNWAGNVRAMPRQIARPADEAELGDVIRMAPGPVRIIGPAIPSRRSWQVRERSWIWQPFPVSRRMMPRA